MKPFHAVEGKTCGPLQLNAPLFTARNWSREHRRQREEMSLTVLLPGEVLASRFQGLARDPLGRQRFPRFLSFVCSVFLCPRGKGASNQKMTQGSIAPSLSLQMSIHKIPEAPLHA